MLGALDRVCLKPSWLEAAHCRPAMVRHCSIARIEDHLPQLVLVICLNEDDGMRPIELSSQEIVNGGLCRGHRCGGGYCTHTACAAEASANVGADRRVLL